MSAAAPAPGPAGGDSAAQAARAELQRLARHQVMGLAIQFLLGMAVNLLGQPFQVSGAAHAASLVFLTAHIIVSAGMLAGAALALRAAARAGGRWRTQGTVGAAAIAATIAAGVLTMITKSNWWSYAMAAGFIASLLIYGGLLTPARAPAPEPAAPTARHPGRAG